MIMINFHAHFLRASKHILRTGNPHYIYWMGTWWQFYTEHYSTKIHWRTVLISAR